MNKPEKTTIEDVLGRRCKEWVLPGFYQCALRENHSGLCEPTAADMHDFQIRLDERVYNDR